MLVRSATLDDIPFIASKLLRIRQRSWFAGQIGAWNHDLLERWLYQHVTHPEYCMYMGVEDGTVVAGCGGVLFRTTLPPHVLVVEEWVWWGESRASLVSTFRAMEKWGERHRAKGSVRVISHAYGEQRIWRAF